jgi:hypothetical protein
MLGENQGEKKEGAISSWSKNAQKHEKEQKKVKTGRITKEKA